MGPTENQTFVRLKIASLGKSLFRVCLESRVSRLDRRPPPSSNMENQVILYRRRRVG
jgi:hypothetical protein